MLFCKRILSYLLVAMVSVLVFFIVIYAIPLGVYSILVYLECGGDTPIAGAILSGLAGTAAFVIAAVFDSSPRR